MSNPATDKPDRYPLYPRIPPGPRYTAAQVVAAVAGTSGIIAAIARKLQVARTTIDAYARRWPTVADAIAQERETVGDIAEGVIFRAIAAGDLDTAKWYAAKVLHSRGYSERQEITGSAGGPILIKGYTTVSPDDLRDDPPPARPDRRLGAPDDAIP